jgi:hypothetical protein
MANKRCRDDNDRDNNKKARPEVKSAKDAVCPWWNVPYAEQLERKAAAMNVECLGPIHAEVKKSYDQHNKQRKRERLDTVALPDWLVSPPSVPGITHKYCMLYRQHTLDIYFEDTRHRLVHDAV